MSQKLKIIISGGGTGGHVFPAISIADALKKRNPDAEILFVGAIGRMEMEKVPAAGYQIVGLPVAGFQRRLTFKNVTFFFKLAASMLKARMVVRNFRPDVAVGVGGYASGPVLRAAAAKGVPTILQEQNSYPGITNKILARKAHRICVAYPGMDRFFPPSRIVLTGNPVRENLLVAGNKQKALSELELVEGKKTILVIGGSLGAGGINNGFIEGVQRIADRKYVQVLWQCGKYYFDALNKRIKEKEFSNIKLIPFISRMDLAYRAADVVVSRAGAGTISELALLGKASILVPSPNVSEDHQTKNAMALVKEGAALLVADHECVDQLVVKSLVLLDDKALQKELEAKIKKFAYPDSAIKIAEEIETVAQIR
jgi:UDP-N-acetylglucosamine--N-acetylmuramyl-(pentapeptide) pyrophosphoryl-undecaprenol N-acetylglucosamine transferase